MTLHLQLFRVFFIAGPLSMVEAVNAGLRSQPPGGAMQGSESSEPESVSLAVMENEEEEDSLLDPVTSHPAIAGFLPPQPGAQSVESSVQAALVQHPAAKKLAPEAVFHFNPPRQRPLTLSATMVPHPVASLPSAGAITASPKPLRPAPQSERFAAVRRGNRTGLMSISAGFDESKPKIPWPPDDDTYTVCNPPCILGRGVCNDNVCWCKSPYTGSTCQHKITDFYRVKKVLCVASCAVAIVFGILSARLVFAFSERKIETRLEHYGKGKTKFETWAPPDAKKPGGN